MNYNKNGKLPYLFILLTGMYAFRKTKNSVLSPNFVISIPQDLFWVEWGHTWIRRLGPWHGDGQQARGNAKSPQFQAWLHTEKQTQNTLL